MKIEISDRVGINCLLNLLGFIEKLGITNERVPGGKRGQVLIAALNGPRWM